MRFISKMIKIKEAASNGTVEGELKSEKVEIGKPIRRFVQYLRNK